MNESSANTANMQAWQQAKNRLPALQRRAAQVRQRLQEIDRQLAGQRQTAAGEQADVDRLQGRSLGNYILQLTQQMDKRQQKEETELIQARRRLDELSQERDYLQRELTGLEKDILTAQQADRQWQTGLRIRAAWLERPENAVPAAEYHRLQDQLRQAQSQVTEIEQARAVAVRAAATAEAMADQLNSAESWGTYDIWFKGGIVSHLAKYDHIDAATDLMAQLTAQLGDLKRELADIRLSGSEFSLNEYSSGTRALDYFFDNIFTDWSVRDRIRADQETVGEIRGQLHRLERDLDNRLAAAQDEIRQMAARQEQFLAQMPELG